MALRSPEREDQIDQSYDRSFDPASRLKAQEQQAGSEYSNAGIDQAEAFANDPANASSKNINATKESEETSGEGWKQNFTGQNSGKSKFDLKGFAKKKGPAGAIIAVVLSGGILGTSLLSPALLLVHMKNVFMNDLSDSTPATSLRSDLMIRNKIKGLGVKAGVCTGAVTIRCKFSTMSNRQVKKFEKAGFTFDEKNSSRVPGRNTFKSMTFDPGDGGEKVRIRTPQEMKAFARTPAGRAALYKAFNPKADFFLNSDFSKMLQTKLGISKESKVKPGDEKEVKSTFNESTNADKAAPAEEGGRFKGTLDDSSKLSETATKGNAIAAGLGVACIGYNTSRTIVNTVKAIKIAAFAAFAMTFLTETDKLIAGDADPSVISEIGNQLTSTDNRKQIKDDNGNMVDNPDYGKSPTDSTGYQLAANNTAKKDGTFSNFSLAPLGVLAGLASFLTLPNKIPYGKTAMKYTCRLIGNSLAASAGVLAACYASIAFGDVPGAVGCIALQAAIGVAVGVALGYGISKLSQAIISSYGPMLLNADTFGTAVGNAYFMGAASVLGGMASSMGMMPANKSSIKSYFADTDNIRKQNIAADVYIAKATPFDIYNQYSFLGSIVQPINTALLSKTTFASKVAGLFNLVPSSFASLGTAGAAYNEPQQPYSDSRFSQCQDQELADIGVNGDEFCNVRYTMSSTELNMDPDQNVQYMVNGGYVDEDTGDPRTDTDAGQLYQKFLDNCVNRKDPLGSTSEEIQNEDDWGTGKNCGPDSSVDSSTMSNFRVFTMDMQTEDAMDQDPGAGSSDTSTPVSSTPTSASAQDLAKEMLKNSNISYIYDAKEDVTLASEGKPGTCNTPIDPQLLAVANNIAQNHKLIISAIESHCTGHMAGSDHYKGKAIDFASIDGAVAYQKIASVWPDFSKDASGAYFLQRQCTGGVTPSGMSWISGDTCSHIHMSIGTPGG